MNFPAAPLDWQNDEDAVRVAQFVIDWIMAEDSANAPENAEPLRDNLKRTTLDAFVHDLLTTVSDDRYQEETAKLLTLIGVWPA